MPSLAQGRIVWLQVEDPQGRNPKIRPVIIVDFEPNKIPEHEPLHGVCVTHQIGTAPHKDCVAVPWHRSGNVKTRLKEQSEAVCRSGLHMECLVHQIADRYGRRLPSAEGPGQGPRQAE